MLDGFCRLYPHYVSRVSGGVIRSTEVPPGKVAVIVGGGSGHYPAFCGIVGPGFADGAVVGNIFTSPSSQDAYDVGKLAMNGGGLLFITGNYAGDVLNFDQAQSRLLAEGFQVRNLYVTDDVASAPLTQREKRRGIAGDFVVFKLASAAAESGLDLSSVEKIARKANEFTRTLGVGFSGCTLPGATSPLFTVPAGLMGLGLGIHGEPGISEDVLPSAHDLGVKLVEGATKELRDIPIKKIAVVLNGLGTTKYEELFVLWGTVSRELERIGYEIIEPEVGELVTSLDMAGCSLTVTLLDAELEKLWQLPADTPAFKKGSAQKVSAKQRSTSVDPSRPEAIAKATPRGLKNAHVAYEGLVFTKNLLKQIEKELGDIDAVAGDGDHGRGMTKGITAAVDAAQIVVSNGGGTSSVLIHSGQAWAAKAGGTSGILWGSALTRAGEVLADKDEVITSELTIEVIFKAIERVQDLGKAELNDKTMLDSMIPFIAELNEQFETGNSLQNSWKHASKIALEAALATSALEPKIGRARPLADKSIGTPDAGATSFARIVDAMNQFLDNVCGESK
jgi:dihydroxyacetone kinase